MECKKIVIEVRKRGRSRGKWQQDVDDDMKEINVRRWEEKAVNRDDWRRIVNEVKVHIGLWCQGVR